jgi:hypothetical protein
MDIFDVALQKYVVDQGGFDSRYLDDILIIVPGIKEEN